MYDYRAENCADLLHIQRRKNYVYFSVFFLYGFKKWFYDLGHACFDFYMNEKKCGKDKGQPYKYLHVVFKPLNNDSVVSNLFSTFYVFLCSFV